VTKLGPGTNCSQVCSKPGTVCSQLGTNCSQVCSQVSSQPGTNCSQVAPSLPLTAPKVSSLFRDITKKFCCFETYISQASAQQLQPSTGGQVWGSGFPAMSRRIARRVLSLFWAALDERPTAAKDNYLQGSEGPARRRQVLGDSM